jgi:hypothetical protein
MKVGIVGSREFVGGSKIRKFIYKLKENYGDELEIVSGGQKKGADGFAKKYALELDVTYVEFPPAHYSWNQVRIIEYIITINETLKLLNIVMWLCVFFLQVGT